MKRKAPGTKRGWGVSITCDDGRVFLCFGGMGMMPVVWPPSDFGRKGAAAHARCLRDLDFKCRVVPVEYQEPRILTKGGES